MVVMMVPLLVKSDNDVDANDSDDGNVDDVDSPVLKHSIEHVDDVNDSDDTATADDDNYKDGAEQDDVR